MPDRAYVVLIEHLARDGRPFPRVFQRYVVTAQSAADAMRRIISERPAVTQLGDLLVSATVSRVDRSRAKP